MSSFVNFLENNGYSTSMWESGFNQNQANEVCAELTKWFSQDSGESGEFLILWSDGDGSSFFGDAELAYFTDGVAYVLPNPFVEGSAEAFFSALISVTNHHFEALYPTKIRKRVLYNAI